MACILFFFRPYLVPNKFEGKYKRKKLERKSRSKEKVKEKKFEVHKLFLFCEKREKRESLIFVIKKLLIIHIGLGYIYTC